MDQFTFDAPDAFYREMRGIAALKIFQRGSQDVAFRFGGIDFDSKPILDLNTEALAIFNEGWHCRTVNFETHSDAAAICRSASTLDHLSYEPLSLVGEILTYRRRFAGSTGGGAPYAEDYWISVNVKSPKTPSILDLVDHKSLFAALMNDTCVKRGLKGKDTPESLKELLEVDLEDIQCSTRIPTTTFAFLRYDGTTNRVAVRFGFSNRYSGPKYSYFGIEVEPTPAFRKELEAAVKRGVLHWRLYSLVSC